MMIRSTIQRFEEARRLQVWTERALRLQAETEGARRIQTGTEEALLLQIDRDGARRRLQAVTEGVSSRDGGNSAALGCDEEISSGPGQAMME